MQRKSLWGAHLFIPANNAGYIGSIPLINVENIILDLEYSIDIKIKTEARCLAKYAVNYIRNLRNDINIAIRINTPQTNDLYKMDIEVIALAKPDAIRVPSVTSADEIKDIDMRLTACENKYGYYHNTIKLHVMIENPRGFNNINEIASSSERIEALCLGGEDWIANLGAERKQFSKELEFIRNYIVTVAMDNGLIPIDSVYPWIEDIEGLAIDSSYSRNIGFHARALQNPRQIETVNRIMRPSKEKIEWAKKLLSDLKNVNMYGAMLFISNGKIIDPVAVEQAKNIISYTNKNII